MIVMIAVEMVAIAIAKLKKKFRVLFSYASVAFVDSVTSVSSSYLTSEKSSIVDSIRIVGNTIYVANRQGGTPIRNITLLYY